MNKFILLILTFIVPASAFTQSDKELIKKIQEEEYYYVQKNLKSFKKVKMNDSINFHANNNEIIKISLIKDNFREEYYFYKNSI